MLSPKKSSSKKKPKKLISAIFLDATIRLITIAARGLFVFAAASYLDDVEFGLYIAIGATISLLQYFVAGDYSYITHRELFAGRARLEEILGAQVPLLAVLFLATIPALIILLPSHIEIHLIIIAAVILLLESITSELQRHLVAVSKFTRANVLLFLKSAGWMMPALCLLYLSKNFQNVDVLLISWTIGLVVSFGVGILGVPRNIPLQWNANKRLFLKYFTVVPIVLVGTLATRALFSVDRIIVEKLVGLEAVGVYGLFVGVAAAFVAILDAGILARSYPSLVKNAINNQKEFNYLSKRTQVSIIVVTIFAISVYYSTIEIFFRYISKPGLMEYSKAGALLILAYGVYSLSFSINCKLYASGRDKTISMINVIALIPLAITPAVGKVTIYSVASSVIGCATLHYLLRYIFQFRTSNKNGD